MSFLLKFTVIWNLIGWKNALHISWSRFCTNKTTAVGFISHWVLSKSGGSLTMKRVQSPGSNNKGNTRPFQSDDATEP